MNWPLAADGTPAAALVAASDTPDTRRAWSRFARRDDVFRPNRAATCPGSADAIVRTRDLAQADATVLVDQAGNFVVYETRMNPVVEAYIRDNALDSRAGQAAFDPQPVEFPQGRLGAKATPASVLLKTSWRVMQSGETGYLTASGLIHVPADRSASATPLCLPVTLGMVGMHIVTRVASGNGDEWLWSTFEHRDNVPLAGSARHVNSLFAHDLFPEGCTHPKDAAGRPGATARCGRRPPGRRRWRRRLAAGMGEQVAHEVHAARASNDQATNAPPDGADWSWTDQTPHARIGGEPAWILPSHAANRSLLGSGCKPPGSPRSAPSRPSAVAPGHAGGERRSGKPGWPTPCCTTTCWFPRNGAAPTAAISSHMANYTTSGDTTWSTFEHRDNVPGLDSSSRITSSPRAAPTRPWRLSPRSTRREPALAATPLPVPPPGRTPTSPFYLGLPNEPILAIRAIMALTVGTAHGDTTCHLTFQMTTRR